MIWARKEPQSASPQGAASQGTGLRVTDQEAGQKLMSLLERRLLLPQSLLHRWIRTGQIRLNGARVQPFVRVATGDSIRMPPFAGALSQQAQNAKTNKEQRLAHVQARATREHARGHAPRSAHAGPATASAASAYVHANIPSSVEIVAEDEEYFAVFKPQGLPTQPGTGHVDAMTSRLAAMARAEGWPFVPTPVHRLDKDTSGLLLVARTYQGLKKAHDSLRTSLLHKEYLVWVNGLWTEHKDVLLRNYMKKGLVGGQEKMLVSEDPSFGKEAILVARPLAFGQDRTLLQILLLTGRTHQIRAQLAHAGFPVVGDGKYGRPTRETLCLHAVRMRLPDGRSFTVLPRWKGALAVQTLPPPIEAPSHK